MATEIKPTGAENSSNNSPETEEEYSGILKSISPGRIMVAALIGVAVVVYMFISQFNPEEFAKIEWSGHVLFWIAMAAVFMCLRHFAYMIRLRIITDGFFTWKKCFELVMMWEFSSAVTPTSVGGAAVAMFAIAQEKLAAGRTAMIVLYTVVVDTFSFLSALLIFFAIFGPIMIQPESFDISHLLFDSIWGMGFLFAYCLMLAYGSVFFYGVLINAKGLQRLLLWFCKFKIFSRFKEKAVKMTEDMGMASGELRTKSWKFHFGAYMSTMLAWGSRFMVLNCLIIAFVAFSPVPEVQAHYNDFMQGELNLGTFWQHTFIYARQQAMYVIMAVLPTPGGAGAAEAAFQTFHYDYIPTPSSGIPMAGTLLVIMAFIWRFFTYYLYLLVGAIVVPNWVRKIIARTKKEALEAKQNKEQA